MISLQHTAAPWGVVKSFNGWLVTRTWSSGFYQRMRTGFASEAAAIAAAATANGSAA